jgi:hypothetical protein
MRELDLENDIKNEFFLADSNILSDEFIRNNPDILWIKDKIDYMIYVPNYMLWCLKNKDLDGNLVCDYTINVLAEFGRSKNPGYEHLNFKFLCNNKQREMVYRFLNWCLSNILCREETVNRAIKRWGPVI